MYYIEHYDEQDMQQLPVQTKIGGPSSNSRLVYCVHIRTSALGKDLNTSLLSALSYGLVAREETDILQFSIQTTNTHTTIY